MIGLSTGDKATEYRLECITQATLGLVGSRNPIQYFWEYIDLLSMTAYSMSQWPLLTYWLNVSETQALQHVGLRSSGYSSKSYDFVILQQQLAQTNQQSEIDFGRKACCAYALNGFKAQIWLSISSLQWSQIWPRPACTAGSLRELAASCMRHWCWPSIVSAIPHAMHGTAGGSITSLGILKMTQVRKPHTRITLQMFW